MRFSTWLVALFALLGIAACEPTPEPEPTPEVPTDVSFTIELNKVGATSVNFDITPSSEDVEYYVDIYDKRFADAFSKDEHIVGTLYDEIAAYAGTKGMTLNEYLAQNTFTGTMTDVEFTGLAPESEYYLLAFAVDASNDYALVGAVAKQAITTTAMPTLEVEFDVTTEVYYNTVTFDVKPSDKSAYWHLITVPEAKLTQYMEGNGWTESQFYFEYMKDELAKYQGAGYTTEQIMAAMFPTGDKQVTGRSLYANTEYVYLVAAVIISDAGEIVVGMEPQLGSYTTEDATPSDMTFNIEVWNVDQLYCEVRITPSNNEDLYCALIQPWDGVSTAQEVMEALVAQWGSMMQLMANDRGIVEHSGANKFKLDAPDTDYYVIAFGYDGGVTTAPQMVTFRTLPSDIGPDKAEFDIVPGTSTTYSVTATVTTNDPTVYYMVGACPVSEFDETLFVEDTNEYIDYIFTETKKRDAMITMPQILNSYTWSGPCSVTVHMAPDSEFMGYILTLDNHTGHVVRCHTFHSLGRTKPQASYEPTIELVGYYSGDEEAGALFGEPEVSAGQAIIVYKYGNFGDAKALYTAYDIGNLSNSAETPDPQFIASYNWTAYTALSKPYGFAVGGWNGEYTAGVYAIDAQNNMSRPARLYLHPTADEKSPIAELFDLYNSLYGTKSAAAPASLVINEPEEPVALEVHALQSHAEAAESVAVVSQKPELQHIMLLDRVYRHYERVRK